MTARRDTKQRTLKQTTARQFESLRQKYGSEAYRAERLSKCLHDEIYALLRANNISLAVPMENRVKQWSSIEDKIVRKELILENITDLQDLIGIRIILLFKRDLKKIEPLLAQHFMIVSVEDTGERLSDSQFGYQSQHYIIRLLPAWSQVPSMVDLGHLTAEIQVRTLAQHMWAAASHKLQYKKEESVPPPLRRAIHRVSALLETVDLEFDRVLSERNDYIDDIGEDIGDDVMLDVDILSVISNQILPAENSDSEEEFGAVLEELRALGIYSAGDLRNLTKSKLKSAMARDKRFLKLYGDDDEVTSAERTARGVYLSHSGLIRFMMRAAFPRKAKQVIDGEGA